MSEYKENTVGWHLDRLKEPLRTDALASMKEFNPDQLSLPCAGYANALSRVKLFDPDPLWVGAFWFFNSALQSMGGLSEEEQRGWDMAKECAPDPIEGTQIFDQQPVSGGFVLSNPRLIVKDENGFKEVPLSTEEFHSLTGRVVYSDPIDADSPPKAIPAASPENPNGGLWSIREDGAVVSEVGGYVHRGDKSLYVLANFWKSLDFCSVTVSGSLFHCFEEQLKNDAGTYKVQKVNPIECFGVNIFDQRFFKIPEPESIPAVVGYEPPREVETIEGRHDREIKELQARVQTLSDERLHM